MPTSRPRSRVRSPHARPGSDDRALRRRGIGGIPPDSRKYRRIRGSVSPSVRSISRIASPRRHIAQIRSCCSTPNPTGPTPTSIDTSSACSDALTRSKLTLGFAIPADQAKRIADELISTGAATHGSLGVQLSNDTTARGASIAEVVDGSPAAAAGLPSGAVVTKVDERVIDGPEALVAAVRSKAPGDTVTLTYLDESGTAQTTQVTLGQAQQ